MNGRPIATDLEVLEAFNEDWLIDGIPRDERLAKKWNVSLKQVYALWNKKRFKAWIDYGVTLRSGWLTPDGKQRLRELRGKYE